MEGISINHTQHNSPPAEAWRIPDRQAGVYLRLRENPVTA